jgi:hypothetical protein
MFVSSNSDQVAKELDALVKKMEFALGHMVVSFAGDVAQIASNKTKLGNSESLQYGEDNPGTMEAVYFNMYKNRFDQHGINIQVGFHKGAWTTNTSPTFALDKTIYENETVDSRATQKTKDNYTLGQTFWVGANGPGFYMLNDVSARGNPGWSLGDEAIEAIMEIYAGTPRLKQYFDEAMER